jgi:hypothetical protein
MTNHPTLTTAQAMYLALSWDCFCADLTQTPAQKQAAAGYWSVMGVICLGGSIYLAYTGSWGWLILGVSAGSLMLRRARTLSRSTATARPP